MKKPRLFFFILILGSCLDRLEFDTGELNQGTIIVEGAITDEPGPYKVRIFISTNVDDNLLMELPVTVKRMTLSDNTGNNESLTAEKPGVYTTAINGIRGEIGKKYSLKIELLDGSVFESEPDQMQPAGKIDSVYAEFEAFQPSNAPTKYGYRVFVDAKADTSYLRWRFTGTFKASTYPEKHTVYKIACYGPPNPPPCSGYTFYNGAFRRTGDCTCCFCWLNDAEKRPHLSDEAILTNGSFKKVELAYIPFDVLHFYYKKYMIKVEQMSLSRNAYQFWKIVKDQKAGLTSLFQPSFGRIQTNFSSRNSERQLLGIFYAASVQKKVIFISGANPEVPYPDWETPPDEFCFLYDACDIVYDNFNASRTPPPEWD